MHASVSQEPFVAGADTWIDRVVAGIPNAAQGFVLIFSSARFQGINTASIGGAKSDDKID
jgi:hypothetical protein